jgi:hypothetical protein
LHGLASNIIAAFARDPCNIKFTLSTESSVISLPDGEDDEITPRFVQEEIDDGFVLVSEY